MSKYWKNEGKYQDRLDELWDLVPVQGNCNTVAGELVRACNRIYYDCFNNGFCNNSTGAYNYICKLESLLGETMPDSVIKLYNKLNCSGEAEDAEYEACDDLMDMMVEWIDRHPELLTKKNSEDLFDYQEPDWVPDEDEDDWY